MESTFRDDFRLINIAVRVGSTNIDFGFAYLASQRLLPLDQQLGINYFAIQKIIASMT